MTTIYGQQSSRPIPSLMKGVAHPPETSPPLYPLYNNGHSPAHMFNSSISRSSGNSPTNKTKGLREFVSRAPVNGTRLHCTMIRHDDEQISSGACYTLYLEYLGGLVPLLKGKRTSKIRPEFVIFDPQADGEHRDVPRTNVKVMARGSDTSDTEREDGCSGSPRAQRKKRKRRRSPPDQEDDLTYVDTLPEGAKLVEVTSNIWGTKFKIHGLADCVPANLGQVTYKTSLLHLQPRQMSLVMTELSDDVTHAPDPSFNPKVFSEDEEDDRNIPSEKSYPHAPGSSSGGAIPIAPMTPRREENRSRLLNSILNLADGNGNHFFRSPRFVYSNPSLLRERAEMRKALINGSKNVPTTSSQEENSEHEGRASPELAISISQAQFLSMTGADRSLPSSSTKNQPSFCIIDRTNCYTYQSEMRGTKNEVNENDKCSSAPDDACNLREFINFCENFKIGEIDIMEKTLIKICQEKTETSFLNNQGGQKANKSPNLQSPKTTVAPCFFCENGPLILSHSSKDFPSQSIYKVKNALEKCLNQEKITGENMKFIDEDTDNLVDRMSRSCSVGYLDDVDTGLVPCELTLKLLKKGSPKRLTLVGGPKKRNACEQPPKTKSTLKTCGKSRSLDSGELLLNVKNNGNDKTPLPIRKEKVVTPGPKRETQELTKERNVVDKRKQEVREYVTESNISLAGSSSEPFPPPSPRLPRSQPVTPAMGKKKRNQSASPIRKHLLNSPLLRRRRAKSKAESSDDDNAFSGDEAFTSSTHFKDLETFQKAQLRQKLKRGKVRDGNSTPKIRELVMHNKAPMWNENSQVYQLDFGGRVTQESAKNFQIEFKGKQVMQFGRIDGNAYTLDFQYPFSVLQAFSVALANVTQRLK